MFEINKAGENTYYIKFPTILGIYKINETDVCFIDGANDKATAKRALKNIAEMGWNLKSVFCTHSHADHVGGLHYLQEVTGCKIYCPAVDVGAINNGKLNPIMLYGGYPPKQLFTKFHYAEDAKGEPLSEDVLPEGLEAFELLGHTLGMVGYKTKDDVYFLADSLSSEETLKRYLATYLLDIPMFLDSLDYVEKLSGKLFIPSHAEPRENIEELVRENRKSVYDMMDRILEICKEPHSGEELVREIFKLSSVAFNIPQYSLVNSTLKAYTTYLLNIGKLEAVMENYEFRFKTK